jgi:hypothetical protein
VEASCGTADAAYCVAERAVDGDTTADFSRWLSTPDAPTHWLVVDLQAYYNIQRVKLYAGWADRNSQEDAHDGLCRCCAHRRRRRRRGTGGEGGGRGRVESQRTRLPASHGRGIHFRATPCLSCTDNHE